MSWLVMVVGVWLGVAIRSGRSGRCALVCGVHGSTVRPRRGILLGWSGLYRELTSFVGNQVWALEIGCRGVLWVAL